ncbi:MAG: response regulator [Lachnospiraceae bacterium]|nr:response regulator [Lachnospiraceae bacterium]
MIKVMLVDDEEMALQFLQGLIDWESYGFQMVGSADNAGTALKMFLQRRPQLIISDVKMPGNSGLDFISEVRKYDSDVRVLFLSGYQSFDFARRAMQLDSEDYLLKSDLTKENLLSHLLPLKQKIDQKARMQKYTLRSIMEDLFSGKYEEAYYRSVLSEHDFRKLGREYIYVIFGMRKIPDFVREILPNYEDDWYEEEYRCENLIENEAASFGMTIVSSFSLSSHTKLAVLDPGIKDSAELVSSLSSYAHAVCEHPESRRLFALYFSERMTIRRFLTKWQSMRPEILNAYMKPGAWVRDGYSMLGSAASHKAAKKDADEREEINETQIIESLKKGERELADAALSELRNAVKQEDGTAYLWHMKKLIGVVAYFDGRVLNSETHMHFSAYEKARAYRLFDCREMTEFIASKLEELISIFSYQGTKKYSRSISAAIAFIRENYMDMELSTAMVSGKVGLSESWLSTKFKDEVGMSVSDYINGIRVENAKRMLEESDLMIYEVSDQCGFTSNQYFSKVFKAIVGSTPNRYRKEHS